MLFTPAYIFTILLGIWVLSLVGCIVLGIVCYRLIAERKRLRARLAQFDALSPGAQQAHAGHGAPLPDPSLAFQPADSEPEPDAEGPSRT